MIGGVRRSVLNSARVIAGAASQIFFRKEEARVGSSRIEGRPREAEVGEGMGTPRGGSEGSPPLLSQDQEEPRTDWGYQGRRDWSLG